MFEGPPVVKLK